jgi:hypothetical protein
MGALRPLVLHGVYAAWGSIWELVQPLIRRQCMEARAATRSAWGVGQHMGAHAALLGVGCMRRVGAYACAMTRERRTDRERDIEEARAYILHGTAWRGVSCV